MKRVVFILGIMLAAIVVLLENSGKRKRQIDLIPDRELEYGEVWWDN